MVPKINSSEVKRLSQWQEVEERRLFCQVENAMIAFSEA